MESVTFSEPTEQENISLEQQAEMQESAQQSNEQQQPEAAEATPQDRPEWLPEKFDNPEALADAYSNLEKQFHENKAEPAETEENNNTEDTPEVTNSAVNSASEEFFETGSLSEETYKNLEANGIPKEMTIAMQDSRYGYDTKYREQIAQRLSVTTAF